MSGKNVKFPTKSAASDIAPCSPLSCEGEAASGASGGATGWEESQAIAKGVLRAMIQVQRVVVRKVNLTHATRAKLSYDPIARDDRAWPMSHEHQQLELGRRELQPLVVERDPPMGHVHPQPAEVGRR